MKRIHLKNKLFFIFVLLFCNLVSSQETKLFSIIKDSNIEPLKKDTITYYFIINKSKKIVVNQKELFQFTFSNDRTQISGYLNVIKNKIFFSEDKKNLQTIMFTKNVNQCNIRYFGKFGDDICLRYNDTGEFTVNQKGLIPTHKLYVSKICWKKGDLFPQKIFFKEKGSANVFISSAKDTISRICNP